MNIENCEVDSLFLQYLDHCDCYLLSVISKR